jgi:hypothetical protein
MQRRRELAIKMMRHGDEFVCAAALDQKARRPEDLLQQLRRLRKWLALVANSIGCPA